MLVCAGFAPSLAPNLLYVRETTYCANANARGKMATGPLRISLITKENMYHAHLLIPLLLASLLQLFLFNGLLFFLFFFCSPPPNPGAQSSSNYWSLSRSGSPLFIAVWLPTPALFSPPSADSSCSLSSVSPLPSGRPSPPLVVCFPSRTLVCTVRFLCVTLRRSLTPGPAIH